MGTDKSSIETILVDAVEIESDAERTAFVERACAGDAAVRQEVERLIARYLQAGSFLDDVAGHMIRETITLPVADIPGLQIGPYKLRELLGEGGMGTVFVAEQQQPVRRKVAMKLIKLGMDSRQVISRFEAERHVLALMDHPNIARVLDAGMTDNGRPYFVMEFVRGLPITEHCDQHKLGMRERLELFLQVCRAIQHAHLKGIIHRDLKPGNVLVAMHDTRPVVKVIDFGVAKAIGQSLADQSIYTGVNDMVGTPLYMSPEQAGHSSLDVDTRSDVYSLGVLLYELLTGCTPFEKETLKQAGYDEIRRIIREVDPPRPSTRCSTLNAAALSTVAQCRHCEPHRLSQHLSGELDWIVMKALEKDRLRRYESASHFAADVERYLNDQPVEAGPTSIVYQLRKFTQRNRTFVVVTGILFVTILTSSAFCTLRYSSERQARRDAEEQKQAALSNAERAERNATEANRQKSIAVRESAEAERQRDIVHQNLYYADMRLASLDLGQGNAGRARDILVSHSPDRGETDHRGWEWHYLLGRSDETVQSLYGHLSEIMTVAWNPDGSCIASVSNDGTARIWDTNTWKLLRTFPHGPTLKRGVHWSPDGRKLAWGSCSDDSALRIWNRDTDQISVMRGALGSIWAVAWSHNGRFVATGGLWGEPGNLRIWDVEKLESIAKLTAGSNITSVSWSADDKLLAVADGTQGPTIWDVASQSRVSDVITERATCAAWHPSEPRLAVGDALGGCFLWDHQSRTIGSWWKAHQGQLTDIKWSDDGSRLLSAGSDGMVKVWDPVESRGLVSVSAHAGSANSVSWDPSSQRFASGGTDHVIRVWNTENRSNPLVIDTSIEGNVNLTWNRDSLSLWLAGGDAGTIVAFDATSGKQLNVISLEQTATRRLVSFRRVVVRSESMATEPAKLLVSDVPAGEALATAVAPAALNTLGYDSLLSPDGTRIAWLFNTAKDLQSLVIRDLHSEHVIVGMGLVIPIGLAWSPDGHLIAVGGRGDATDEGTPAHAGWVHVFNAESGERVRKFRIGPNRVQATAVGWSHDGRRIAAGTEQGLCEVWEWESGRKLASAQIHSSRVNDLVWSPDDLRIGSGGINEQVHLWDPVTGQQLLALESQKSPIRHIRWSPDGRKLATVSNNGLIYVWDASHGYELPQRDSWEHMLLPRKWTVFDRLIGEEHWLEAASLLREMIEAGNDGGLAISRLALVNLQLGDEAGYRDACQRMLAAAVREEKAAASRIALVCALRPATLENYGPAIAIAQQAVEWNSYARHPLNHTNPNCSEALGAILFRAGRYEEAFRHLQAADEALENERYSTARTCYLLAMTHQRLGHSVEARKLFERANQEADEELSGSVQPASWDLRLTLKLFKDEAARLVGHVPQQ